MNTTSTDSTPSPPASSSLHAPTLPEAPEVKLEVEDIPEVKLETFEANSAGPSTSTALITTTPLPPIDFATILRSNPTFQALLAQGSLGDNPSLTIAKLFGAARGSPAGRTSTGETPKKSRLKVFSNGFFMTFDKVSSCQNKHFWRCEYKNTCKARMHTDINSDKIVTYIHEHNHTAPTDEEVRLYGIDPTQIEKNRVYVVGNIADPNQRRKIRKQVAEQEAAAKRLEQAQQEERQKQQNAATIAAAQAVYARAVSSSTNNIPTSSAAAASLFPSTSSPAAGASLASMSSPHAMLLAQLAANNGFQNGFKMEPGMSQPPNYVSPNLPLLSAAIPQLVIPKEEPSASRQPSAKRRAVEDIPDDNDLRRDPLFEPTFEIARKLRKLWKGEPSRYPRLCGTPSTHFEFYLSKEDGSDEHLYVPLRIEQRDEAHLKEALQKFVGQNCIGMLLFGISPKISVMFNQPMISSWENNQFFLLDISNPSRWRLMYVDDRAN